MFQPRNSTCVLLPCLFIFCLPSAIASAQSTRFQAADSAGVQASRHGSTLELRLEQSVGNSITIPRLAAPLSAVQWMGAETAEAEVNIKPEQEEWILSWKQRPSGTTGLLLHFDHPPLLLSEIRPVTAQGDGSFWLPAHYGFTSGEKIRYEPQSYKNTVGYWVGKQDQVTWHFQVDTAGQFNVGILQGCGRGQGGSQARITISNGDSQVEQSLDFEVLETGHFQDFQWRHLGTVDIPAAGKHTLTIKPLAIQRTALMDVRAVNLVRMPPGR